MSLTSRHSLPSVSTSYAGIEIKRIIKDRFVEFELFRDRELSIELVMPLLEFVDYCNRNGLFKSVNPVGIDKHQGKN